MNLFSLLSLNSEAERRCKTIVARAMQCVSPVAHCNGLLRRLVSSAGSNQRNRTSHRLKIILRPVHTTCFRGGVIRRPASSVRVGGTTPKWQSHFDGNPAQEKARAIKKVAKSDAKSTKNPRLTVSILLKIMVSRAGLEPATTALKVRCSTN